MQCSTHPRHDELSGYVLYVCFDLGCDVQLVAVQSDAVQVRQHVILGPGLRALVGDLPREFVQLRSCLGDLLGGVDDVHGGFEWPSSSVGDDRCVNDKVKCNNYGKLEINEIKKIAKRSNNIKKDCKKKKSIKKKKMSL